MMKRSMPRRWMAGMFSAAWVLAISACDRSATDCSAPANPSAAYPVDTFSGTNALREVGAFIARGPRDAGTAGAERAALYIASRLKAAGLQPVIHVFTNETPTGPAVFRNVSATIAGQKDSTLLLASHYDTRSGIGPFFVGANDSGSSTGLLLAMAPLLARSPARLYALQLMFFDGEECRVEYDDNDGFHGSRYEVDRLRRDGQLKTIRAMILLDMVGDARLSITLPGNSSPKLASLALEAAYAENARTNFSLSASHIYDDHTAFLNAGIPAIDLIDFEYGSAVGRNDYWHTVEDTLDKLSPHSLEVIGRVTLRMLERLQQGVPVHESP